MQKILICNLQCITNLEEYLQSQHFYLFLRSITLSSLRGNHCQVNIDLWGFHLEMNSFIGIN